MRKTSTLPCIHCNVDWSIYSKYNSMSYFQVTVVTVLSRGVGVRDSETVISVFPVVDGSWERPWRISSVGKRAFGAMAMVPLYL